MTEQAQAAQDTNTAAATSAPAQPAQPESVEQRKAEVLAKMEGQEPAEKAEPAETSGDLAKEREDRRKRLDELYARERENEKRRAEKKARAPQVDPAVAARAQKVDALERTLGMSVDELLEAPGNEERFFRMAERLKVHPQKLGEYIRDSIADPTKVAAREAKEALSPLERKLAELERRAEHRIASLENEIIARDNYAAEASAANALISHTKQSSRLAPYASAFLEKKGESAFVQFATHVASEMPANVGLQAVLDQVEQNLEAFADIYGATPSTNAKHLNPPNKAAAKATTITNSLASRRAAIADESAEFAALPLDERLAILKRKFG